MLELRIPASTSNLGAGLDVFGLALRLYLKVRVEKLPRGKRELCFTGEGSEFIAASKSNNLILTSMKKVFAARGMPVPGYAIRVHNSIPLSRGLGSSGAAILAGVIAANYTGNLGMTGSEILTEAVRIEGHPDNICPSFAGGFTASLLLECDGVKFLRQRFPADLRLVFVVPDFHVSTKKARDILPKKYPAKDVVYNLQRTALMFETMRRRDFSLLAHLLSDRLHQSYRAPLVPGLEAILRLNAVDGLIGTYLSGSGPAVCAVAARNPDRIGKIIAGIFEDNNVTSKVLILKADRRGIRIVPELE